MSDLGLPGGPSDEESAGQCRRMQEMWGQSLGQEEPLEEEMAAHSRVLAWETPRTEEPGGLQSVGSHRVDLTTEHTPRH